MAISPTTMAVPNVAEPDVANTEAQVFLADKTYEDYLVAVEEHAQMRVEFLDGVIIMSPAPRPIHQIIIENLMRLLGVYIWQNRLGRFLPAPLDVELWPMQRMVQPDLIFIAAERVGELIGERRIHGAPDLAIEILSPSTAHADRHHKLPRYAQSGIPEVWLLEPDNHAIELYLLDGDSYRLAGIFLDEDVITIGRFAEAAIPVAEIFAV